MSRLSTIHRQDDIGRHENPPASPFLRPDGPRAWEPALLRGLDKAETHSSGGGSDAAGISRRLILQPPSRRTTKARPSPSSKGTESTASAHSLPLIIICTPGFHLPRESRSIPSNADPYRSNKACRRSFRFSPEKENWNSRRPKRSASSGRSRTLIRTCMSCSRRRGSGKGIHRG